MFTFYLVHFFFIRGKHKSCLIVKFRWIFRFGLLFFDWCRLKNTIQQFAIRWINIECITHTHTQQNQRLKWKANSLDREYKWIFFVVVVYASSNFIILNAYAYKLIIERLKFFFQFCIICRIVNLTMSTVDHFTVCHNEIARKNRARTHVVDIGRVRVCLYATCALVDVVFDFHILAVIHSHSGIIPDSKLFHVLSQSRNKIHFKNREWAPIVSATFYVEPQYHISDVSVVFFVTLHFT